MTTTTTSTTTTTTTKAPTVFIVHAESSHTPRTLQASNQANDPKNQQVAANSNVIITSAKSVVDIAPKPTPKPAATSTFSPEEDAKFLAALVKHLKNTEGSFRVPFNQKITTSAFKNF